MADRISAPKLGYDLDGLDNDTAASGGATGQSAVLTTPAAGSSSSSDAGADNEIVVTARNGFRLASYGPNGGWGHSWNPFSEIGQNIFGKIERDRKDIIQYIDNLPRDAASNVLTNLAKGTAAVSISAAIGLDSTSDISKSILEDFMDGTGPTQRIFGPGSDAVTELFSGPTGEYFRSESQHAIARLAQIYGGSIPEGGMIDHYKYQDYSPSIGAYGLKDGIQIGDVVGTFTSGITVKAHNDMLYFEATNRMSLQSFSGENLLRHGLVQNPQSGPFSNKYQIFRWTAPIPQNLR